MGYDNHLPDLEDSHTNKDNENKLAFCGEPARLLLYYKGKLVLKKVKGTLAAN